MRFVIRSAGCGEEDILEEQIYIHILYSRRKIRKKQHIAIIYNRAKTTNPNRHLERNNCPRQPLSMDMNACAQNIYCVKQMNKEFRPPERKVSSILDAGCRLSRTGRSCPLVKHCGPLGERKRTEHDIFAAPHCSNVNPPLSPNPKP